MNRLHIDFAHTGRRPGVLGTIVLAASLLTAGAATWEFREAEQEAARLVQEIEARQQTLKSVKTKADKPGLPERSVLAINQAITRLNLPWDDFFAIFEAERREHVALLALEPDSQQGLRVIAEAKTPADMTDFIATLASEKRLSDVKLVKHEINDQDPNLPIRFQVEAQWGSKQ